MRRCSKACARWCRCARAAGPASPNSTWWQARSPMRRRRRGYARHSRRCGCSAGHRPSTASGWICGSPPVMRGLDPRIHVFLAQQGMDGRDIGERSDAVLRTAMPGHDNNPGRRMKPRFVPTARQTNWLLCVGFLSVGWALWLRYRALEFADVSLACQAGLDTWLCATFRAVIVLYDHAVFGAVAVGAALI